MHNPVLEEILRFRKVTDEHGNIGDLHSEIPPACGKLVHAILDWHKFTRTIEIGCAFGISSLYICDAISTRTSPSHTIIDPHQATQWRNIGIFNLRKAGFTFFNLIEKPSELALPELVEKGATFDFALIDGWHTFDHTLLDFFYLNLLLEEGGVIVFDDVNFPSVNRALRYILNYPNYEAVTRFGPNPRMFAIRKTGPDRRSWDWYKPF